jgi:hypothetical protein
VVAAASGAGGHGPAAVPARADTTKQGRCKLLSLLRSVGRGEGKSDTEITCQCGQSWVLRVLQIGRGQVRLGFQASQAVRICRSDAKARAEGTNG